MCRKHGHLAKDCSENEGGSEINWYTCEARETMTFDDPLESPRLLCQRCKDLDLLAWLREDPPIDRDRDLADRVDDPRLFRSIGRVDTIVLRDDCGLCRCLYCLIPYPTSFEQDVKLVLSWSMYRIEAAISMDTQAKRSTSKYIAAMLDPSDSGLPVEDLISTRGDALCAIESDPLDPLEMERGLRAKRVDPNHIDLEAVRRWLSTCERLHPVT